VSSPVYFDYAASTPIDEQVVDAMSDCLRDPSMIGNPASSYHQWGRRAAERVEWARTQVAALINAEPGAIVWTSGATESDSLALIGAARFRSSAGRHIVTSITEHPAVLDTCRYLEAEGFRLTCLTPDANGIIDPQAVRAALTPETTLVSIMHVNNEIGVIQDIAAIGQICRAAKVIFHVDAAQSAGRLPIDVRAQNIDLMSLSAQKVYGPKGVGALYIDSERVGRIEPLFFGGGQERGIRPGTVATHQVIGMAKAYEIAASVQGAESTSITALRERLWQGIKTIPGVLLNGHPERRVCHILSVSVTGVEGESLHYGLRDLGVSAGSACATSSDGRSMVLRTLGRSDQLARATVRFSLGRQTTADQVDFAIDRFRDCVGHLRRLAPASNAALA
jgi:cysteine desulfurase